ncbi:hypothetical protein DL96DRAFT_129345 [Flagelloscypha sp. PMI_526]|nr:hypothetical protein DL96DRAFT_129345 [Flagelloscypha sp. PMI_526]
MDAQEARVLSFAGFLIYFNTVSTIFVALGYAVYFPVFFSSVQVLQRRIRRSVASRFLFALTLVLFISTTIHFASSLAITLKLVQWTNIATRTTPVPVRMQLTTVATAVSSSVAFYSGRINIALVDAIVIWRAYVLWPNNVTLRATFAASLLVTVIFSIVIMVLTPSPEKFGMSQAVIDSLNVLRDAAALAVNIFATVCIGIQGWRLEKTSTASGSSRPLAAKVLAILVEGGVVLAALQIITISLGIITADSQDITDPAFIGFTVITEILIAASAIYPSMMTVLVAQTQDASMEGSTYKGSSAKPSAFSFPTVSATSSMGMVQGKAISHPSPQSTFVSVSIEKDMERDWEKGSSNVGSRF